jgi:succinate-acetate transporter protein
MRIPRSLKKLHLSPVAILRYVLVSLTFVLLGVGASFGVTAFAQVAGYPDGVLRGTDGAWYCDSPYTLVSFRRNSGSTWDADWWMCEDSGEANN